MSIPDGAEYVCEFTGSFYKGSWPNMKIWSRIIDEKDEHWVNSVGSHEKYLTKLTNENPSDKLIFYKNGHSDGPVGGVGSTEENEMKIQLVKELEGFVPQYATEHAAGADLRACLPNGSITIYPGERKKIPTGLRVAIPEGYELQIRSRSGLSLSGIVVLNSLTNNNGTVDADYRGEIGVILCNIGDTPYMVHHGFKIAQAILAPVIKAEFEVVESLGETERGENGFGSSGV